MEQVKQVIILRKDLNMRKGKMVAQGCHASLKAYEKASKKYKELWEKNGVKKICVGVNTEEELFTIHGLAQKAGLPCYLVLDSGHTEFNGNPTFTAVAIGPANENQINKITGNLSLL